MSTGEDGAGRAVLRGGRVTLRPPRFEELSYIRRLWEDPGTMAAVGGPVVLSAARLEAWFSRLVDPGSETDLYLLILDEDEQPVGEVSYHRLALETMRAELNVKVEAHHRGRGLGREAVLLLLGHFFSTGGRRMVDDIALANRAGQRALLELGFRHDPGADGVFRVYMTREMFEARWP